LTHPEDSFRQSRRRKRLVIAFVVAPLAAPAAYEVSIAAVMLARVVFTGASLSSIAGARDAFIAVAAVGIPVAYGAALLAGLPIYLFLRRRGPITAPALRTAGAVIGALVALLIAPRLRGGLFSISFPVWAGILLGLLCGEVFRRLLPPSGLDRDGGAGD